MVFFLPDCEPTQEEYDKLFFRIVELESQLDECQNNLKYTKQIRQ